jgi:ubiquitin-small subunit ribosomal protein S27Ae
MRMPPSSELKKHCCDSIPLWCRPQVKLHVLKYYKVDGNGKITRLRKVCPSPQCGPGVFMASHFDRQYCGKCGLTYMMEKGAK